MILATHGILQRESVPFFGILDDYPNAAAAYSLRRLSGTYRGKSIRVRRTDLQESDIGFTSSGELNTTALLAFTGTGALDNGFVTTWYDQSGNARNATQSTLINQPQIVSSGSVILQNGKPCLQFDGINDSINHSINLALNQPNSIISVAKRNDLTVQRAIIDSALNLGRNTLQSLTNQYLLFAGAGLIETVGTINTNQNSYFALFNGVNSNLYVNNNLKLSGNVGTQNLSSIGIGALQQTSAFWLGNQQELIIYNSNESSNRTGIETNVNDFYSIY
jgi:hypothetical protein